MGRPASWRARFDPRRDDRFEPGVPVRFARRPEREIVARRRLRRGREAQLALQGGAQALVLRQCGVTNPKRATVLVFDDHADGHALASADA